MNFSLQKDLDKVVAKVKTAQTQFQNLMKNQGWVDDAKKYAERQSKELKKLLGSDASKVKAFLERQQVELEKIQKQIPSEVEKLKTFVSTQRKELKKLIKNFKRVSATGKSKTAKKSKSGAKKKASASVQA